MTMARCVAVSAAVVLASAPLAAILTIALVPFWRWLEATSGIESIGHSGPADWCSLAMFVLCLAVLGGSSVAMLKRGSSRGRA